jgi:hypothetical protein
MSACIYIGREPASMYPVLDPYRTAGRGPYEYAYGLAWDGIQVTVNRFPSSPLTRCQMRVDLVTSLREFKEIQAWNLFANNFVDRIGTAPGLQNRMVIQRPTPGTNCGSGTDTLVLARYFAWPRGRTALYSFIPTDFWDCWGGCDVTINWLFDHVGSGIWGNRSLEPQYPLVKSPDNTVMQAVTTAGTTYYVVAGGAAFPVTDPNYLTSEQIANAVPFFSLATTPADGTLIRESNDPRVYVCYGGAKFWIPSPAVLFALGFDWGRVRIIPPGSAATLGAMPMNGTLLREQSDPRVYLVRNGMLSWVTSPAKMTENCLAWRHIRIVPDNALTALPRGANI